MSWYNPIYYLFYLAVILNSHSAVFGQTSLTLGEVSGTHTTVCQEYSYFKVKVTDCSDLNIKVTTIDGQPDVYVSRGDQTQTPTLDDLTWSSYDWGNEDLTISSFDPEYRNGFYYIGVHAYCGDDVDTGDSDASYTVLAQSVAASDSLTEIAINGEVSSTLVGESYAYYRLCIPDNCKNIEVQLDNCITPPSEGGCPIAGESYTWPELLVSPSTRNPTIHDQSWKLAQIDRRSVYIPASKIIPGHYFVGVYAWCTPAEFCPPDAECGPCSNYASSPYTIRFITGAGECGDSGSNSDSEENK